MISLRKIVFGGLFVLVSCGHPASDDKLSRLLDTRETPAQIAPIEPFSGTTREFDIHREVGPCQNFYKHACTEEIKRNKNFESFGSYIFQEADTEAAFLQARGKYIRSLLTKKSGITTLERRLRNVYKACLSEDQRKRDEKRVISVTLAQAAAFTDPSALLQTFAENILSGGPALLSKLEVVPDVNDSLRYSLSILPELTLGSARLYQNNEVLTEYRALLEIFFAEIKADNPAQRAEHVLNYERTLAESLPDEGEMQSLLLKPTQLARFEATQKYPMLRLEVLLKELESSAKPVVILNPVENSLKTLDDFLANSNLETLKSLYLFKKISPLLKFSPLKYIAALDTFRQTFLGASAPPILLDDRCVAQIQESFPMELAYLTHQYLFPEVKKSPLELEAKKLVQTLKEQISRNLWLTSNAKIVALKKLENLRLKVVAPENQKEWGFVPPFRESDRHDIENLVAIKKVKRQNAFFKLKMEANRDPDVWEIDPHSTQGQYIFQDNLLYVTMGQLVTPFYAADQSAWKNTASSGWRIARQLGKAYGSIGIDFNEWGSYAPWLTGTDLTVFRSKLERISDSLNKAGFHSKQYLDESLADLFAVEVTYRTAFPRNAGSSEHKRQFFFTIAHQLCGAFSDEYQKNRLYFSKFAPEEYKVNEMFKQMKEFQSAFECREGDPMAPSDINRTTLWASQP